MVERFPYYFRSKFQLRIAAAGSALMFATIENILYVYIYIPASDPSPPSGLILWRWTVCTALHLFCTMIAVEGVARVWHTSVTQLREPNLTPAGRWLVAAILLHGLYNAMMVVQGITGWGFESTAWM